MEELKKLMDTSFPIVAIGLVVYLRNMILVVCMGSLGSLELAGGALAIGFTNITGYSVLLGLAMGMEPLCSQAFGSRNFGITVLILRRTILMLLFASMATTVVHFTCNASSPSHHYLLDFLSSSGNSGNCNFNLSCQHLGLPSILYRVLMRPFADVLSIHIRRGGINKGQSHSEWLSTISQSPNVISMSFVPIASLLSGVNGSGFLSHAINLYLRYKPPIEELRQFLDFQIPRQWAPTYGDLPLARCRRQASPALQFTFMGPKLYVNTTRVDSGNRPVTGIRLYLEGKSSDHLAIHLQHLSTLPQTFQLTDDHSYEQVDEPIERAYFEPVKWSIFSHVCTAPVEYRGARIDDSASIVTKSWFEVKNVGMRRVLFLRLGFSMVVSSRIRRSQYPEEWDGPSTLSRRSGLISTMLSAGLTQPKKPAEVILNSAVYPGGPPSPARAPKMTNFVDTKEMVRGPEDPPGYWVVTGAKLCVEGGRIRINVKYSLLNSLL